jgi:acyl-CoA synthetase (AMP-forming)/AMP-acid ligase II
VLIGDILRLSARRHPARIAVICGAARMTYGALDAAANRFANAVLAAGIGRGDRVAIMSRNAPEYLVASYGTARTGAVLVNLMPAYAPAELAVILARTAPRLIVVEAASEEKLAGALAGLATPPRVVVIGAPRNDGAVAFGRFIAGSPDAHPVVALADDEPVAMTFTGGTTGLPKGAVVSHRARFTSAWITALEHGITGGEVIGVLTPLYHAMGLLIWLNAAVLVGATMVILPGWDPDALCDQTARHGIGNVIMVPVQLAQLLSDGHFSPDSLASLRTVGCGGATTPVELVHEIAEKMPWARFIDHYGQSETGPLAVFKPWHPRDKAGTVGQPAIGVELALMGEDGVPVPQGAVGEIAVRGPFLMDGYFNDPEETAAFFRTGDGWGWTGDLASMDADGFLTLVGRSKDMIVSGGVNIYPREVEMVLERHEAVADCTVFGIPDPRWGEALAALVVRNGAADIGEAALIAFCEENLARFKRPKLVRFVDAIPRTPSGKVQKPRLREALLRELAAG